MRITVDINKADLEDLAKYTSEKIKSRAVNKAVEEFLRRRKLREFGRLIREGAFIGAFPDNYDPDAPLPLVAEDASTPVKP
jgi:hypothetical protein